MVIAESTITGIRESGPLTMLTTQTEIRSLSGDHVCTATSTLVERGAG